jgi:hypothetical protein
LILTCAGLESVARRRYFTDTVKKMARQGAYSADVWQTD